MATKIVNVTLSVIIIGCAAQKLAEPTEADVERGKSKFSNITLDELKEGKKLYETNCNLCHKLYNPVSQSEEEWKKVIPPMVKKVNKKTGQTTLTAQDEEKILHFILVMRDKK
ncbi:MAG: hypothetical protein OHK0036_00710 [Bacteroidia bacterium]